MKKKGCPLCKAAKAVTIGGAVAVGTLFTVYFLNLDQKLLSWAYVEVNEIFNRKSQDIKF
ncbi:MAG: hypothetical protein KBS63_02110 [Clostridiales bacterium]|nr:hypothetical protein [Candidatus Crickella caballi]